jgi:hypothetical protein
MLIHTRLTAFRLPPVTVTMSRIRYYIDLVIVMIHPQSTVTTDSNFM